MPDTMIERVARAICCPDGCVRGPRCSARDLDPEAGWLFVHPHSAARAALSALREPTEGMADAAWLIDLFQEFDAPAIWRLKVIQAVWSTMIDAALKEAPDA